MMRSILIAPIDELIEREKKNSRSKLSWCVAVCGYPSPRSLLVFVKSFIVSMLTT